MKRTIPILFFSFSIFLGITCNHNNSVKEQEGQEQETPPNIIWLMAEDIGTDLECYDFKGVSTPNLNRLAEEGIQYSHCYCTNPICSPNRSAMMTGVHQNQINAQHHRSNRDIPLPQPYQPITHYLRQAGYTCIIGDSLVMNNGQKTDCNFKHTKLGKWDGQTKFGLFDKENGFSEEDQPFFSHIQLLVTHRGDWWKEISHKAESPVKTEEIDLPPYMADHPVIKEDWARYCDQIEYMDMEVGLILDKLDDMKIADNTVVIFIGDNGRCNIRGKGYLYEPGIHIPLIVRWPEKIKQGIVSDRLVSTIDISASVLDIAGLELPDYMSSIPFIGKENAPERNFVYSARDLWDEVLERSRSITTGRYIYIRNYLPEVPYDAHQAYLEFYRPAIHVSRSLLKEGKLNELQERFFTKTKPTEELYDMVHDPYQTVNLVHNEQYNVVLDTLRSYLDSWQKIHKDHGLDAMDKKNIVYPAAVDILEWVKEEKPDVYQKMLQGEEIGFQHLAREYRQKQ